MPRRKAADDNHLLSPAGPFLSSEGEGTPTPARCVARGGPPLPSFSQPVPGAGDIPVNWGPSWVSPLLLTLPGSHCLGLSGWWVVEWRCCLVLKVPGRRGGLQGSLGPTASQRVAQVGGGRWGSVCCDPTVCTQGRAGCGSWVRPPVLEGPAGACPRPPSQHQAAPSSRKPHGDQGRSCYDCWAREGAEPRTLLGPGQCGVGSLGRRLRAPPLSGASWVT